MAHFLLRGQSGAEPGEEDDPTTTTSGPLYEDISDVRLQETVLHSQHQTLVKAGTRGGLTAIMIMIVIMMVRSLECYLYWVCWSICESDIFSPHTLPALTSPAVCLSLLVFQI